eukprot:723544_1
MLKEFKDTIIFLLGCILIFAFINMVINAHYYISTLVIATLCICVCMKTNKKQRKRKKKISPNPVVQEQKMSISIIIQTGSNNKHTLKHKFTKTDTILSVKKVI